MIVVMSDLHFSEAQSTQIGSKKFDRNLPVEIFKAYFKEINQYAVNNEIQKIDLVLAGDILEISRSAIWLEGNHRPYISNGEVEPGSEVEKFILKIIEAIGNEGSVKEILFLFRKLDKYFEIPVQLHLILGNHDRLVNATPRTRRTVREMFGLGMDDDPFENYRVFNDDLDKPFCLVRHGHEYDPTNFSMNTQHLDSIPVDLQASFYDKSCFGDIITIEFGAALSWYFVQHHGVEKILGSHKLLAIYERLMEFDDVRPTTAWLAYLFSIPGVEKEKIWQLIEPSFTKVINALSNSRSFFQTFQGSAVVSPFVAFSLKVLLRSGLFKQRIPFWVIKRFMGMASKSIKLNSQVKWAKREELILNQKSGCKCVISGHTHFAEVSLISAKKGDERYYINTGTWRNVIPAAKTYKEFGLLKAMTKVIIFYPMEKEPSEGGNEWSFQYMSGVSFGNHRYL